MEWLTVELKNSIPSVGLILIACLLQAFLFAVSLPPPVLADSGPPWVGDTLDQFTYTEGGGWVKLDSQVSVTSDTNDFTGGYVEVEITDGTGYDELRLVGGEDLSVSGRELYWKGRLIGRIDGTRDGSSGRLRINFVTVAPLENAGFESGDLTGWSFDTMGNKMWGQGWTEGPDALGFRADSDPEYDDQNSGSGTVEVSPDAAYTGNYGLYLSMTGGVASSYGTGHAPSVTSPSFSAESGDRISFWWKASKTTDYYDVFAFVFADSDGDGRMAGETYQLIFHDIGADTQGWRSEEVSLNIGGSDLRLKFLNGCYDHSGNKEIGSYLYIDEIKFNISDARASDSVVEEVIEGIEYRNTSDNPDEVKNYELKLEESDGGKGYNTGRININQVNDPPVDINLSDDSVDENIPQGSTVGTLSAVDPDDSSFSYSITGGDIAAFQLDEDRLETARKLDYESKSTYNVRIRARDGNGGSYEENFVVSVNNLDDQPVANAGPDRRISLHEVATLDGSGSTDPDSDELDYSWSPVRNPSGRSNPVLVEDNLSDPDSVRPEFFPTGRGGKQKGVYRFELTVSDGNGNSDSDQVRVVVTGAPEQIRGESMTSRGVRGSDPASYDFRGKADLAVDLQNMDSTAKGLIGGFSYEPAKLSENKVFPDRTVKYVDVKAIDINSGSARISLYYSDQEVSEFQEAELKLYVYSGGSWSRASNIDVNTLENVIRGDVDVSKLEGSPITASANQLPSADFSYSPSEPQPDEEIKFDATLSSDPDGSIATYKWDWENDGSFDAVTSSATGTHSYPEEGIYTVKLKVIDDEGGTDSVIKEINIARNTVEGESIEVEFNGPAHDCGWLRGIKLKYSEVTAGGSTDVTVLDQSTLELPEGVTFSGCFYRVETTAKFSGDVRVEISYDDTRLTEDQEKNLKLFKLRESGEYENITNELDPVSDIVTGSTGGFSFFSLGYGTGNVPEDNIINHGPSPVTEEGCIFWLDLPVEADKAVLKLFDVGGKLILEAVMNGEQNRYPTTGRWKPRNQAGNEFGSGIYFYRLKASSREGFLEWSDVHKLVVGKFD